MTILRLAASLLVVSVLTLLATPRVPDAEIFGGGCTHHWGLYQCTGHTLGYLVKCPLQWSAEPASSDLNVTTDGNNANNDNCNEYQWKNGHGVWLNCSDHSLERNVDGNCRIEE